MPDQRREPGLIPVRGAIAFGLTASGLALLLGLRSPGATTVIAAGVDPATADPTVDGTTVATVATVAATGAATSGTATATAQPASAALTLTGEPVQIRWGTVQVQVVVQDGRIVDVQALELPSSDRHSASLAQRAEPILRQEAVAANGANIDVVSGATYTSQAYAMSLQSALDQLAA